MAVLVTAMPEINLHNWRNYRNCHNGSIREGFLELASRCNNS